MIDLVYLIPFQRTEFNKTVPRLIYTKPNGTLDHHQVSKDKLLLPNCYDQFTAGQSYVVISQCANPTVAQGRRRWIWTECWHLEDEAMAAMILERIKRLDPNQRVPGYTTTRDVFDRACYEVAQAWKIKQKLKQTAKLVDELLEF